MNPRLDRSFMGVALLLSLFPRSWEAKAGIFDDKRPDAAVPILQAFMGSCDSVGAWTQSALAQTASLQGIIEGLESSAACQGYSQQLIQIQALSANLAQSLRSQDYQNYQQQTTLVNQLTLEYDSTSNVALQSSLASALSSAEANQSLALTQYSSVAPATAASTAGALASYLNQLATPNSSPTLGDCLRQSPAASVEIATNLLSFSSSFVSSVLGTAVSVVGNLINAGFEVFRQNKYDAALWASQLDQMPMALRCAMESMTEYYCRADDAENLIELSTNHVQGSSSTPLYKGLDFETRYLPSLITWMDRVESGVAPETPYSSAEKIAIRQKREQVLDTGEMVTGLINQEVESYLDPTNTDPSVKDPPVANLIVQIATLITANLNSGFGAGSSSATSIPAPTPPFAAYEPSSAKWACWLLVGHDGSCPNPPQDSGFGVTSTQLSDWLKKYFLTTPAEYDSYVPKLLGEWNELVGLVEAGVDLDFERIIQTDAAQIITDASEGGINGLNTSPAPTDALKVGITFLELMKSYPLTASNPNLLPQVEEKINQLSEAVSIIDQKCKEGDPNCKSQKLCAMGDPACPGAQLQDLAKLFDLSDGSQVFSSSMSDLVEIDLLHRLKNGEFPKKQAEVLRYLGARISTSLAQSGLTDKNALNNDLNDAQALTEGNLRDFRNFFLDAYSGAIQREDQQASGEDPTGPHRPHGEMVGALCIQWLITGAIPLSPTATFQDWPNTQVANICQKAAIYSANRPKGPDGNYVPALSVGALAQTLKGKAFHMRVCQYHDYQRLDYLSTQPGLAQLGR